MKIGLAPTLSVEVAKHQSTIVAMAKDLSELLLSKNYGEDIFELHIGLTSISPQFASFFKAKSPKYVKGKKSFRDDDVEYEFHNSFEYDIKLNFEAFKNADEREAQIMIAKAILSSLDALKKFKKFDNNQFKSDLEGLFKSKGWL